MKRHHLVAALALLVCLSLTTGVLASPGAATEDATIGFTSEGPEEVTAGEEATFSVRVEAPVQLYSAEVAIAYPTESAVVSAVAGGEFLSANASSLVGTSGTEDGTIRHAESRTNDEDGVTGTGVLVTFTVAFDSDGTYHFGFADAEARDPDVAPLTTATEGITVSVLSDGTDGSSSGSGGSDGGDGSESDGDANDSPDDDSPDDDWPAEVDQDIRAAFADVNTVSVMASTAGEPDTLAEAIRERGGTDVTVLSTIDVVAFTGNSSLVRWVGEHENVTRVRQDDAVETQGSIRVVDASLVESSTAVGSAVTVSVTVLNEGDADRTGTVTLAVDGESVQTRELSLGPSEERTVSFEFRPDSAGEFHVTVDTVEVGVLTVTETTETPRDTDKPTHTPTDDDVPGFGVMPAILAVFLSALLGRNWHAE